MSSIMPMFPTKYWAKQLVGQMSAEVQTDNLLQKIMRCGRWNIDIIINNYQVRQVVYAVYKEIRSWEDKEARIEFRRYMDWIDWCISLDCPIDRDANEIMARQRLRL